MKDWSGKAHTITLEEAVRRSQEGILKPGQKPLSPDLACQLNLGMRLIGSKIDGGNVRDEIVTVFYTLPEGEEEWGDKAAVSA